MKFIFLFVMIFTGFNVPAQDQIKVTYGNKTTRWYPIPEKGLKLDVVRKNYTFITRVTIDIKLASYSEAYKRNIHLAGSKGNFQYNVNESKIPGRYVINLRSIQKMLTRQKVVKVYLQQNPANDKMMIPSKQTLLAEVHIK